MIEMKAIDQERMAERALGQIEGAALCQSDLLRDILMGAVEDIDEAMKQQRARIKELEESAEGSAGLLEYVLKQKDELLTENARLREQVEGLKTTPQSADADSSPCAGEPHLSGGFAATSPQGEEGTSPALCATSPQGEGGTSPALCATSPQGEEGERIAASGLEDTPCNEKDDLQENSCSVCRNAVDLFCWGGIRIRVCGDRLLVETPQWETTTSIIKFCPKCGRKL